MDKQTANVSSSRQFEIIELWRLPLNFYRLELNEQWKALAEVTSPVEPNLMKKRTPCSMVWSEQLEAILWMLLCLGLPLGILPISLVLWFVSPSTLKYWAAALAVLAFHPLTPYSIETRRRKIGLIMARYFSFVVAVDRKDPQQRHFGTPDVDKLDKHFPLVPLACPHGVLNFGATIWVYFERWLIGMEQYTAAAPIVTYVPGLRYFMQALWPVSADRSSLKRCFRERPSDVKPRGGCVGIVPDGVAGIFHSRPGTDVLHIGKKRGLMRIGLEEGVKFGAGWFVGTTDCFNIVQDSLGIMQWLSRKLRISLFIFYGRWGLPIPRRSPTTLVMKSTTLEKVESPSADQVEVAHQQVYGALVTEFEEIKHCLGLSDRTLVLS